MVEIYDFPDGRLEIRWKGRSLPYSAFDKLQRVNHAAIVENKRLGEILAWIKEQQDRQPRFNRVPDGPRRSSQKPGTLKNALCKSLKPPNRVQKPIPQAGAAPIWWSPRRRLTLPARLPSDISTLQSKRHLNLVATALLLCCRSYASHPIAGKAANDLVTLPASFRSCPRFPICLHRQTGAGLSRLLSDGRNNGPPMCVGSLTLSDASCCQNKICP